MAASPRPVTEIQIGGNTYRVQSSADATELARLVAVVEARLAQAQTAQRHDARSFVLVALSLAHDLEQERAEHRALRAQVDERLTALVGRIDQVLDHRDENGDLLPPVPQFEVTPPVAADADCPPPLAIEVAAGTPPPPATSTAAELPRRGRKAPASGEARESVFPAPTR